MIKNFGKTTREWLVKFFKSSAASFNLPKIWKKARVVALLKHDKDPKDPKSYRPISLVCVSCTSSMSDYFSHASPQQLTSNCPAAKLASDLAVIAGVKYLT